MKKFAIGAAVVGLIAASVVFAADPGVVRTELQRAAVPNSKIVEIFARAVIQPGSAIGFHTHPGDEIGIAVSGELTVQIKGQPDKIIKPGESFHIPAGTVHNGLNAGTVPYVGTHTYLVESDKPLATPAP